MQAFFTSGVPCFPLLNVIVFIYYINNESLGFSLLIWQNISLKFVGFYYYFPDSLTSKM